MALDDKTIKAMKGKNKPYTAPDGLGLVLLVKPSGAKLWRFRYRFNGKANMLSLGAYPIVSLAQARVKRDVFRKLLAEGADPSAEKKQAKIQSAVDAELTFEKVLNDWLEIKKKTLAPSTFIKMQSALNTNFTSRIGNIIIKDLRYKDMQACLFIMQARGALRIMHEARGWLKSIFDFAVNEGFVELNPITKLDDRLSEHQSKSFPHLQSMDDAGKLLRNLTEYGGTFEVQACAYLTIHIAQRPSELRNAKWCEFDFDNALWTIPLARSKSRKHMTTPHVVPLSRQALQVFNELQPYTNHSEYLFYSARTHKPLSEATIRKAFLSCFSDYHIVPHGCRHFFSTQTNESGLFRKEAIDAFLQHKDSSDISAVYNKAKYAKERADIAKWWSEQLDVAQAGAKVLPFKTA